MDSRVIISRVAHSGGTLTEVGEQIAGAKKRRTGFILTVFVADADSGEGYFEQGSDDGVLELFLQSGAGTPGEGIRVRAGAEFVFDFRYEGPISARAINADVSWQLAELFQ